MMWFSKKLPEQGQVDSPLVRGKNGDLRLQFDQITLRPGKYPGAVDAAFCLCGKEHLVMQIDNVGPGDSITLSGIEGTMGVRIE